MAVPLNWRMWMQQHCRHAASQLTLHNCTDSQLLAADADGTHLVVVVRDAQVLPVPGVLEQRVHHIGGGLQVLQRLKKGHDTQGVGVVGGCACVRCNLNSKEMQARSCKIQWRWAWAGHVSMFYLTCMTTPGQSIQNTGNRTTRQGDQAVHGTLKAINI